MIYIREDRQQAGAQFPRHHAGGIVLVDDRLHPLQPAARVGHHRDAAATTGDDQPAPVQQEANRLQPQHLLRARRGHHPPIATPRVLHHRLSLTAQQARAVAVEERPDGLGRPFERRIVRVHAHLRQHASYRHLQLFTAHPIHQRLLQQVAHLPLRLRHAEIKGQCRHLGHRLLHAQHEVAYLRPVAVHQQQAVLLADERHQGAGQALGIAQLLGPGAVLARTQEGVAPYGDDGPTTASPHDCYRKRASTDARSGVPRSLSS